MSFIRVRGAKCLCLAVAVAFFAPALSRSEDRPTTAPSPSTSPTAVPIPKGILANPSRNHFRSLDGHLKSRNKVPSIVIHSIPETIPATLPQGITIPEALQIHLREGRNAILNRDYQGAVDIFVKSAAEYPESPVGPMGLMMTHQAHMLENYDYVFEPEFLSAAKDAGERLRGELARKGNEGWDYLLSGAYHGMVGLHAFRHREWVTSLSEGLTALMAMRSSRKATTELTDMYLGLGSYDYFRSVITNRAPWIPFFSDKRKEGLLQMERTLREGHFCRPVAQIALIYTLIDEHRYRASIELSEDLIARYPGNIIARIQLGRALSKAGQYDRAIQAFEDVLVRDPRNRVALYYMGSTRIMQGKDLDKAEQSLVAFLGDPPTPEWRGWAYERLGDLSEKRGDLPGAVLYWEQSLKINPGEPSPARKLKKHRKKAMSLKK